MLFPLGSRGPGNGWKDSCLGHTEESGYDTWSLGQGAVRDVPRKGDGGLFWAYTIPQKMLQEQQGENKRPLRKHSHWLEGERQGAQQPTIKVEAEGSLQRRTNKSFFLSHTESATVLMIDRASYSLFHGSHIISAGIRLNCNTLFPCPMGHCSFTMLLS